MAERSIPGITEMKVRTGSHESVFFHAGPEKQGDRAPTIYAVGWGSTVQMHRPAINALALRGKDVWSYNPVRKGKGSKAQGEIFPEVEMNKSQGVYDLLGHLQEEGEVVSSHHFEKTL